MQRRAAAIAVALFLVFAAGSYTLIGAAQQPDVSLDDPDYSISEGEERTIAGTSYTFSSVSEGSATATWDNESARYTETWSEGDTVAVDDQNYSVAGLNASEGVFELREVQEVDRETIEQNETTYVVIEEGENRTLVPRDSYLPEQDVLEFAVGDDVAYDSNADNETVVASVTDSEVTVEWFAPGTFELEFSEGENTSVEGTEYLAHVETSGGSPVLELTTDYENYHSDVAAQETFHERTNGLWGVVILSTLAAALLVMLAYLPSRY
jgi:hypothetical protein